MSSTFNLVRANVPTTTTTNKGKKGDGITFVAGSNPHTKIRTFWCKQENSWKYINVACVCKWTIKRVANLVGITVLINKTPVRCSSKSDQEFVFDFSTLREKWFDSPGTTPYECALVVLEDACMCAQLKALHHFSQAPRELLERSIFTEQLEIFIIPEWKPRTTGHPDKLEIDEEYIVSDIHKNTYKDE
jgi:hypothetical protein